ncbi:MAG: MBOAT family protein [Deltaproteobacteria bacterium]|nr:MBOAT family protein [Deltaproteobacteria bacterium]
MLFHSLEYILFLMVVLVVYWALARMQRTRILFTFLASCRFYMAWNVKYITLILASTVLDYTVALMLHRANGRRAKKAWLMVSLVGNLGMLGTFKYFNFFASAVHDTLSVVGIQIPEAHLALLLPVGISFYTFQTLSYTIDVYRGVIEPERNFLRYAFYVTYFPQLVAGPIVRARDFLPQIIKRPYINSDMVGEGLFLILRGLVKKVIVADFLAINLADRVFDNPAAFTSVEVMIGLYAYTMQLYCDFSGYTDVARGSARLMGFRLPENFERPYQASSPAEFWRRWHMTLSSWLRDYLYFPLGGSRGSPARTYFNLWLTLFLIGLWHGAGWTFVVYGAIHGCAMVAHRFFYKRSGRTSRTLDPRWMHVIKVAAMFHFTVLSRILFRSPDLTTAGKVTAQLFQGTSSVAQVSAGVWAVLAIAYLIHWTPQALVDFVKHGFMRLPAVAQGVILAVLGGALMEIASTQVVPYIYFQF